MSCRTPSSPPPRRHWLRARCGRVRLARGTGEHPTYTCLSLRSDLATKRKSDIRTTTVER